MQTFCTIITADYLPKALVLAQSVRAFNKDIDFHILIADNTILQAAIPPEEKIVIHKISELSDYPLIKELFQKYAHINFDNFRWSLKPVFASYLLRAGYDKLIYADCDMYFVNDFNFLLNDLDQADMLLTPHWNSTNPLINQQAFLSNFTSGIFSAGFFGATRNALPALDWWANACHFMMGAHIEKGVHDDQRYLDIVPVIFENTRIVRHRGCNIGSWNFEESQRELVDDKVMINGKYPVIFIHFDEMLISTIQKGHDKLLEPFLHRYQQAYDSLGFRLADFIPSLRTDAGANALIKLKWKLQLKTRIKRFLYKLAESL